MKHDCVKYGCRRIKYVCEDCGRTTMTVEFTNKNNNGGPAFPCELQIRRKWGEDGWRIDTEKWIGMTLWDYFAAHAIASGDVPIKIAEYAAEIADAMMAEREKRFKS